MSLTAKEIHELINYWKPELQKIPDDEATEKPLPHKWSKKEILGHLVDSATNNQMKFVRAMESSGQQVPGYHQDEWVSLQHYQEYNWLELIDLWILVNRHIAHIIQYVSPDLLVHTLHIDNEGPFTLEYILRDYPKHQLHHLRQILPNSEV